MLRKQTYLLSVLLALVLAAFIGALILQNGNSSLPKEEASLRFVSAYGAVNYVEGEGRTLDFCFMTKGDWSFSGDPSFRFDSPLVGTKDVRVTKRSSAGPYSFWDIACTVELLSWPTEGNVISLTSVVLDGMPYRDVIDLRLMVFPSDARQGAPFELVSHGSSADFKSQQTIIRNVSDASVSLRALEFPAYENTKTTVTERIPGDGEDSFTDGVKASLGPETVTFLPRKYVELEGDLSRYEIGDGKKCYYIDPVLQYQVDGEDRVYPLFGYETYPCPTPSELKALWESVDKAD